SKVDFQVHPTHYYLALRAEQPRKQRALKVTMKAVTTAGRSTSARDVVVAVRESLDGPILRSARLDTTAGKPGEILFTGLGEGSYQISAEAWDGVRPVETSMSATVFPPRESDPTEEKNPFSIQVAGTGRVGESLRVRLHAPPGVGSGMLAVLREGLREGRPLRFSKGFAEVVLPVAEGWVPGVTLAATAVLPSAKAPVALLRCQARVSVSAEHRRLHLRVSGPASGWPGKEVSFSAEVKDGRGQPVSGARLSAWAVDEGVLSLTLHKLPDLGEIFVGSTDEGVQSVDTLSDVIAPYDPMRRVLKADRARAPEVIPGLAGVRGIQEPLLLRENFQTTPFFLGDVAADQAGHARFRFRLPHNLTRFRVSVVAAAPFHSGGPFARFGSGETGIEVGLPMLLRPLAPRFLRVGDHSEAAVVVHNRSHGPGSVEVSFAVESPDKLQSSGETRQTIVLADGEERRLAVPVNALAAGQAGLRWSARFRGRGGAVYSDALKLPLAIIDEPVPRDRFAVSGHVSAGQRLELPTQLPVGASRAEGELAVQLANTLIGDRDGAMAYLVRYPYGCAEQTASGLLPFLIFP
ncbi:MAG TPA: alpha-2-macroglobulin family protein, partial [Polyangia bacterium]